MKRLLTAFLAIYSLAACNNGNSSIKSEGRQVKQYSIEQFYKSINVGGGAFSSDETRLLINSNESGIYNAYEIDLATGQKKALTRSTKESIFTADYVPGTKNIIYSADKGGNENDHLFLLREDSSVKDLTPGEKEKASFFGWSRDGK